MRRRRRRLWRDLRDAELEDRTGLGQGHREGADLGRTQQRAEVSIFALELKKVPKTARSGLYAGLEDGALLKLPAYVEVVFVTPEAKLYALERLESRPTKK